MKTFTVSAWKPKRDLSIQVKDNAQERPMLEVESVGRRKINKVNNKHLVLAKNIKIGVLRANSYFKKIFHSTLV